MLPERVLLFGPPIAMQLSAQSPAALRTKSPGVVADCHAGAGGNSAILGHIIGRQMSMQVLATPLSRFEKQIVIDMTELKGSYELNVPPARTKPESKQGVSTPRSVL